MAIKSLGLFSGNANRELAEEIAHGLGTRLGAARLSRFSDGEMFCQIEENVRGVHSYVIQPTCSPVNDNLIELLIMVDALRRASAGSITAVLPYYGYARQDRKMAPRTPITSRMIADLLTTAGVSRVLCVDLHAAQIQGFFNVPFDHLFALPVFLEDYLRATFDWHIDGCTPIEDTFPQMATVLSAKQVASTGGETEFASSYAAYDAFSAAEKERYGSLRVVHSLEASQRRVTPNPSPEVLAKWRSRRTHTHPLVWTHRSGRKSLVLGASADYVVGLDRDEGMALLADLLDRATSPEKVYRHTWSVGDTVVWDNRGVLHRAAPYDPDSPREMLRTTVRGDEPIQ